MRGTALRRFPTLPWCTSCTASAPHRYFGSTAAAEKKLPFPAGFEAVGVVAAVAPGVQGLAVGQPVASMTYGGFSDWAVVEGKHVFPVPRATPEMVGLMTSGLTASIALEQAGLVSAQGGGGDGGGGRDSKKEYGWLGVGGEAAEPQPGFSTDPFPSCPALKLPWVAAQGANGAGDGGGGRHRPAGGPAGAAGGVPRRGDLQRWRQGSAAEVRCAVHSMEALPTSAAEVQHSGLTPTCRNPPQLSPPAPVPAPAPAPAPSLLPMQVAGLRPRNQLSPGRRQGGAAAGVPGGRGPRV